MSAGQRQLLGIISRAPLLHDNFIFTGGTALSACYLSHRYSDDLDLFTAERRLVVGAVDTLREALEAAKIAYEIRRRFETFAEIHVTFEAERVRLDLAYDAPYRLSPPRFDTTLQLYVDNPLDIACNKLSALFDRAEAKDFVDVYFIHQTGLMRLEEIIPRAKEKHIGLEEYWLARSFYRITEVQRLPRMVKPLALDELRVFFLDYAKRLMEAH